MIKVINVNKFIRENKLPGPVTSPQIFLGKSTSFHPQGLLSEDIFGIEGSPERRSQMSWIDLNTQIIHPVLFDSISKRIERKLVDMLSGEKIFNLDENGELIEDPNGILTGYTSFIKNINKLRFREDEKNISSERNRTIRMMYDRIKEGTFFVSKLLVVAPDYRPVFIPEGGDDTRPKVDEMNELYIRIIKIANQLKSVSGNLYDVLTYQMQMLVKEILEFVRIKIAKKHGMIRDLMLGKRVDLSARGVIAPDPTLKIGYIGVPLTAACSLFEPFILFGLVNSPYSKNIPEEFHQEVKNFLGKELDPDLL